MIPIIRPYLDEREADAAREVILSGWVVQGPKVREFEQRFAERVGSAAAVAVSSGTAALHLSLLAAGVGPGDEVILPSLTYIACANAVVHCGAKPVFVDVDAETYNIDPVLAQRAISERTKAIMLVHQIGMPGEIEEFTRLAEKHNLVLIEDAACAVGSEYKGEPIGSHSRFVTFSFHPRKVLTTGDGGMIAVQDEKDAAELRLMREHGISLSADKRHSLDKLIFEEYIRHGFNYRMTDIQAAVGIEQLKKLDEMVARRRELAEKYRRNLGNIPGLKIPNEPGDRKSNWQSYMCLVTENAKISRNELMQRLLKAGISTRRGIHNIHREPVYEEYANQKLPISEMVMERGIILPLYHIMTEGEHSAVCENIGKFLS